MVGKHILRRDRPTGGTDAWLPEINLAPA